MQKTDPMTHAERLHWLEQAKGFAAAALGAANPSIERVARCARGRFPDARIDTRRYVNGWWMDVVTGDHVVVIEFRAGVGFGVSVLAGTATDHFSGHEHTFATVDALEAHLAAM